MSEQPAVLDDPGPALLALYDSALPRVYGYLLSRCGRASLAEDLTAETFLAAANALPGPVTVNSIVGSTSHKAMTDLLMVRPRLPMS